MEPKHSKTGTSRFKRYYKYLWFRIMWYAIIAYAAWCAVLYFQQDKMLFPADMAADPLPAPPAPDIAVTRISIGDEQTVESWFYPATAVHASGRAPVVVFFHGNAEIIDHQDPIIDAYRALGYGILLPEYRGYGRSGGKPSQEGIVADAVRFYDEMIQRDVVDPDHIVFHGRSLGGAVAAAVAEHRMPHGLILESTFSSVAAMSRNYLAPSFLAKHPFRTDRLVARADIPTLIFHGSRDTLVPPSHGRKLRDLARRGEYVEFECGHNDFPGEGNEESYWQAIGRFLADIGITQTTGER